MELGLSGMGVAIGALAVLAVCGLAEAAALRRRWVPYHRIGFPLADTLRDLPGLPASQGVSPALRWWVVQREGGALFQARGEARRAPRGMHGWVALRERPGGAVAVEFVWAPLWTPALAFVWLAVLGITRAEPAAAVAGVAIAGMYMFAHHRVAQVAAAELRWAFLREGADPSDQPSQSGRPS